MTRDRGEGRDFAAALARYDAAVRAAPLPRGPLTRLLGRRRARRRPSARRVMLLAFASSAVAAVVALVAVRHSAHESVIGFSGFSIQGPSPGFSLQPLAGDAIEVTSGSARLVDRAADVTLAVRAGTRLGHRDRDVLLLRGHLDVSVHKRPRVRPVRIAVSHGVIEVVGTRFSLEQRSDGGELVLHEGTVRFVPTEGRQVLVHAGGRLRWPVVDEPPPRPPLDRPAAVPKSVAPRPVERAVGPRPPPLDTGKLLRELDALRVQHRYRRLAARIEQALPLLEDQALAESLSYELADVTARELRLPGRACRRFAWHARRFPRGRYAELVREAQQQLDCDEDGR